MKMNDPVDFQTIYECPFCLSIDLTVKKPYCYCHDCERPFDIDEVLSFEPEDD